MICVQMKYGQATVPVDQKLFDRIVRSEAAKKNMAVIHQNSHKAHDYKLAGNDEEAKKFEADYNRGKGFLPGFIFQC